MTDAPLLDDDGFVVEETGVGDHADHQPAPDLRQDIQVTTPLADRIDQIRRDFPAKFSPEILDQIRVELRSRLITDGTILDPFAGVGGVHALRDDGYDTIGVDIEPEFAACDARTTEGDSTKLTSIPALAGHIGRVRVIVTSPAYGNRMCLAAGQLVTTWDGPTPIEDVQPGQLVLTHRGRWRPVVRAWSTGIKPVVAVEGQGGGRIVCTPDHRFWSAFRNPDLKKIHSIGWRRADELVDADTFRYWATPSEIEPCPVPAGAPRGAEIWWFIGFWLGNGSVGRNSTSGLPNDVIVTKDVRHADRVCGRLEEVGAVERSTTPNMMKWAISDVDLACWLRVTFGTSAYTKTVPGWTLGLDADERSALLDGWLNADGHTREDRSSTIGVSVSLALVRGMQLLAASVGRSAGYGRRGSYTGEIGGRPSRFVEAHRLDVHDRTSRRAHQADGSIWYAVRSVAEHGTEEVFDLEVEEDHSFVVNGIAVHNSDQYLGSDDEKCRRCNGSGQEPVETAGAKSSTRDCTMCGATGKARSERRGYAIALGRRTSANSGAGMAWGRRYRSLHGEVIQQCDRMLEPGGWWMVNVSSFLNTDGYQPVMEWWLGAIARVARVDGLAAIETRRMKHGENRDRRVPAEHLIVARKA